LKLLEAKTLEEKVKPLNLAGTVLCVPYSLQAKMEPLERF
jgi:hypothetical protein